MAASIHNPQAKSQVSRLSLSSKLGKDKKILSGNFFHHKSKENIEEKKGVSNFFYLYSPTGSIKETYSPNSPLSSSSLLMKQCIQNIKQLAKQVKQQEKLTKFLLFDIQQKMMKRKVKNLQRQCEELKSIIYGSGEKIKVQWQCSPVQKFLLQQERYQNLIIMLKKYKKAFETNETILLSLQKRLLVTPSRKIDKNHRNPLLMQRQKELLLNRKKLIQQSLGFAKKFAETQANQLSVENTNLKKQIQITNEQISKMSFRKFYYQQLMNSEYFSHSLRKVKLKEKSLSMNKSISKTQRKCWLQFGNRNGKKKNRTKSQDSEYYSKIPTICKKIKQKVKDEYFKQYFRKEKMKKQRFSTPVLSQYS